jgi:hypothetical protein
LGSGRESRIKNQESRKIRTAIRVIVPKNKKFLIRDPTSISVLEPEVAKAFPSEKAVNEALMSLIKLARASTGLTKDSSERS